MYKRRFATVIHCLLALNLICSLEVQAVPTLKSPNEIPKQIRDALGELQVVTKTPVLLPTWLPASSSGPLGVGRGPFKDGYEIWLGSCSADTTFFMSGGKGKIVRTKRKAKLKDGTVAYVQTSLKDFCMDWSADSCCYRVGKPSQGSAADVADLVKIANSLKVVPLAVMKTQPVGENRIVESIKLEQKSNALTQNIKIGDLYYSAVKNTVKGNYSKAEAELNELIAKWKDCFQMPPLAQAQMALVMVLKKENKLSEAAALEKKCADSARKLEGEWQAQIKAKHEEFVALGPEEKKESRLRVEIGKQRTNLADLYLTQGKFSLAENTYKAAFVDVASTYGRNHYEAVAIAEHYENLLRLNGRSPDPAKQLIQLKPTGRQAVRIEFKKQLSKMNGAEKLVIVLEDEYGAPSGIVWFTKKGWLQGEKGGSVVWKKPLNLQDGVNMDTAGVDVTGGNTFTLWYTPPNRAERCGEQRYSWNGSKITMVSIKRY